MNIRKILTVISAVFLASSVQASEPAPRRIIDELNAHLSLLSASEPLLIDRMIEYVQMTQDPNLSRSFDPENVKRMAYDLLPQMYHWVTETELENGDENIRSYFKKLLSAQDIIFSQIANAQIHWLGDHPEKSSEDSVCLIGLDEVYDISLRCADAQLVKTAVITGQNITDEQIDEIIQRTYPENPTSQEAEKTRALIKEHYQRPDDYTGLRECVQIEVYAHNNIAAFFTLFLETGHLVDQIQQEQNHYQGQEYSERTSISSEFSAIAYLFKNQDILLQYGIDHNLLTLTICRQIYSRAYHLYFSLHTLKMVSSLFKDQDLHIHYNPNILCVPENALTLDQITVKTASGDKVIFDADTNRRIVQASEMIDAQQTSFCTLLDDKFPDMSQKFKEQVSNEFLWGGISSEIRCLGQNIFLHEQFAMYLDRYEWSRNFTVTIGGTYIENGRHSRSVYSPYTEGIIGGICHAKWHYMTDLFGGHLFDPSRSFTEALADAIQFVLNPIEFLSALE
jgi:hypothetical protein